MRLVNRILTLAPAVSLLALGAGCGVRMYPGQPGVVTDGFSKLSMESLQQEGLYVYETTYDNRPGGPGVASIVTKLYPGAKTYTSNVRTNAHGTKYITKDEYQGAIVQMISLPPTNQVILPTGTHVQVMVDYATSMDEVDQVNQAESSLFASAGSGLRALHPALALPVAALRQIRAKIALLHAGKLDENGVLSYSVTSLGFGDQVFTSANPISVQTDLAQWGIRAAIPQDARDSLVAFIEGRFPHGYAGDVTLGLAGGGEPISVPLTINTPKTLGAVGSRMKVVTHASPAVVEGWLARTRGRN